MLQAPIVVEQYYWADQPRGGQDRAMREIFLSNASHSLGRYWRECTFGFVDLQTGGVVAPIQSLGLTHDTYFDPNGDLQSHRTRDETIVQAIANLPGYLPNPGPKIVFMFDNPSPAGAGGSTLGSYAVLDFAGSHSYMAHEVGHALGFEHSYGHGDEYGDPYCLMSALTFGGSDPTHPRPRPADSAVPLTVVPADMRFWDRFGPMPSAASLYRTLPEFAASPHVRQVGFDETVTVRALSEAGPGDVVLVVLGLNGLRWMAELRVATNWDGGLAGTNGPGEALVLHGLLPVRGHESQTRVDYQGRIPVGPGPITGPADLVPPYLLPNEAQPDVRLVLESFDPASSTARVKFAHRSRPTIHAAERLGPASVIQADFGAGEHKNFEACILDGDELWHWWRDNSLPWQPWQRGQQIAAGAAYPGTMIQANFGSGDHGNFEVVVPIRTDSGRSRLRHYAHDNSIVEHPWLAGQWITSPDDDVAGAAALIQSDYGNPDEHGNFEVVVALRQPGGLLRLRHYWRDNNTDGFPWRQGNWVTPEDQAIVGSAALIQSDFRTDGHGHFEVVVPIAMPLDRVGLRHFWGVSSQGALRWFPQEAAPEDLLRGFYHVVGSPSLIQSDFGSGGHGNFELVVPVRTRTGTLQLRHVWIDKAGPDPHVWQFGQYVTESCRGTATVFRSSYELDDHRNFEVLVQEDRGALAHYWHPNDNVNYPWLRAASFDVIDDVPRVEPSAVRIAQLTGEHDRTDWDGTGTPPLALNRTASRFGIVGTDLGVSFEHGGSTYVLYGDTWRVPFDGDTDNLDAIAVVDGGSPDDGLQLTFFPQPPRVPGIGQGGFEVPIDGVSWNGAMYVFFSTDHYKAQGRDLMGRTVVARSDDGGHTFTLLYSLPAAHFINVSASIVDGAVHGLDAGPQLVLFGSSRYRSSDVYLAVKPASEIEAAGGWRYFSGTLGWTENEDLATPLFPAGNVGELSVRWSAVAQNWLAFWNENDGTHRIVLRAGVRPHGPWNDPVVVLRLEDGLGKFIHQPGQDHTQHVFGDADNVWGDVYGPYQFEKHTRRQGTNVRVFFSLSTWNPYQSMLMRTDLPLRTFADSLRNASRQFAAAGDEQNAAIYGARADTLYSDLYSASLNRAEELASSAEQHHVTGYQLIWAGDPDLGNIELAKQREAARSAVEIAGPMVEGLPDPALGSQNVLRLATLLWRLIGFLTHGSSDMAPGVKAADLARRAYEHVEGDHRVDVVQVWTDLAQRHHETGYWFGLWAGNPDLGESELRKQREAAAAGARRANEVVAELPERPLDREKLTQLSPLLNRLSGTATAPGMLTHGAPADDPELALLEALAEATRRSAERVSALLGSTQ